MMNYDKFCESIKTEVANQLPEHKVDIHEMGKINSVKKTGLVIKEKNKNISPIIYLEEYYQEYLRVNKFHEIAKEIVLFYKNVMDGKFDTEKLMNFEDIKNKIGLKLINTEKNREFLKTVPSIPFLDLSIIFYVLIGANAEGIAGMNIINEHMINWNVTVQDLWKCALKNSSEMFPAVLQTMTDVLKAMMETKKEGNLLVENTGERDGMYVLSNQLKSYGASCIVYPDVPEVIGEILKRDYYIIPSSIHEIIIIPIYSEMEPEELDDMICEVNSAHVAEEEVLSDHCYRYIRAEKQVVMR